jgi:ferric-dicitrate binding protein FerR (iron transport regulator)
MTQNRQTENTDTLPFSDVQTQDHEDDALAKLITLAGPRSEIPLDAKRRVHSAVHDEWNRATRKPRTLRWAAPLALAASVILALTILIQPTEMRVQSVGSVAKLTGIATGIGIVVGDTVNVGDVLDTAAGHGISVTLRDDTSLRIAANSMLRVDAPDEFTLLAGRIYIDSGDRIYRRRHVTIHTENGSATDIGTQFSVSFNGKDMSVAVREGRVDVRDSSKVDSSKAYTTQAGQRLHLHSGQEGRFESVGIVGPEWDWATSLAPAYDIESGSFMDFLRWVARETGKELVFASDEVRMAALGTQPYGSVAGLTPLDALESVMQTTKFKIQVDDRTISVSK